MFPADCQQTYCQTGSHRYCPVPEPERGAPGHHRPVFPQTAPALRRDNADCTVQSSRIHPIPAAISASSSFVDKSFPPYRPEKSGRPIQQMHGKDPDQQSSDMPGKPVSYRYALKFLLFEIFHKRMGRGPQCVPLPIDHLTAHRWYAIFSYSAPAMRKNSAGDSTVTPKSLALDNLLPAFSPQTR